MGQAKSKKSKREKLLEQHPLCCFCGGLNKATTLDHVPNRAFFRKRDWPLGYEFPACDSCQTDSRIGELVCAAVARVDPNNIEEDLKEIAALYKGFSHNDRESFKEFLGPERVSGLILPNSVQARLRAANGWPIMNIGPRIQQYLENYAEKLTKALYYMHTAFILPRNAKIEIYMVSNADIGTPQELLLRRLGLPGSPKLVPCSNARTGRPLIDQFEYTYVFGEKIRDAAFAVRFHRSFRFAALVTLARA